MVEQKLRTLVADLACLEENQVKAESHFLDDLGFDSLDTVELCILIEEEFDMEIPDDAVNGIATFEDAVRYVNERLA